MRSRVVSIYPAIFSRKGNPATTARSRRDADETANADWPRKFPPSMRVEAKNVVSGIDSLRINSNYGIFGGVASYP